MSTASLFLGFLCCILSTITALCLLFSTLTHTWVVVESGSPTTTNQTYFWGLTHTCYESSCLPLDYSPTTDCDRSSSDVTERYDVVEGFLVIGFIASFLCIALCIFTTFRIKSQEERCRIARGEVPGKTLSNRVLQNLRLAEEVLEKRILGAVILSFVSFGCTATGLGLFDDASNSFTFCKPACEHFESTMAGVTSCGYGNSYLVAVVGVVTSVVAFLGSILFFTLYKSGSKERFEGVPPPTSHDEEDSSTKVVKVVSGGRRSKRDSKRSSKRGSSVGSLYEDHDGEPGGSRPNGYITESERHIEQEEEQEQDASGKNTAAAAEKQNQKQNPKLTEVPQWQQHSTSTVFSPALAPSPKGVQEEENKKNTNVTGKKVTQEEEEENEMEPRQAAPVAQEKKVHATTSGSSSNKNEEPFSQKEEQKQEEEGDDASQVDTTGSEGPPAAPAATTSTPPRKQESRRESRSGYNPLDGGALGGSNNPKNSSGINGDTAADDTGFIVLPEHRDIIANLQGTDWSWAESHGLYWSGAEQLYFDPESQNFYDPERAEWYDPETEEWYTIDEEE